MKPRTAGVLLHCREYVWEAHVHTQNTYSMVCTLYTLYNTGHALLEYYYTVGRHFVIHIRSAILVMHLTGLTDCTQRISFLLYTSHDHIIV